MDVKIPSLNLTIQGNATTQSGAQGPLSKEDIQSIRDQFGHNLRAQIANAKLQADAQGAAPVLAPLPPVAPRVITIHGKDGNIETIEIPNRPFDNVIPPQAADISIAFFVMVAAVVIGLPLARAFARRMDRRGATAEVPREVTNQLAQLNQSVDAIALEIERISEGQRFTTRLLSEQRDAARQTLPSATER